MITTSILILLVTFFTGTYVQKEKIKIHSLIKKAEIMGDFETLKKFLVQKKKRRLC